ncbi:MAG: M48 family metalloprotease [Firmicutes bacterium]|nr:M48 family metalloprotease [Bacillota bacterium]
MNIETIDLRSSGRPFRTRVRISTIVELAAAILVIFSLLASGSVSLAAAKTQIDVGEDMEKHIGEVAAEIVASHYGGTVQLETRVATYLQQMMNALAPLTSRPKLTYRLVVTRSDVPVAVSLPGGYMVMSLGMLNFVRNGSELANLIAHDMAHISRKHVLYAATGKAGFLAIAAYAFAYGLSPSKETVKELGVSAADFAEKGVGEESELEADLDGAGIAAKAGFDPQGMVTFLERAGTKDAQGRTAAEWLKMHQAKPERLTAIKRAIDSGQIRRVSNQTALALQTLPFTPGSLRDLATGSGSQPGGTGSWTPSGPGWQEPKEPQPTWRQYYEPQGRFGIWVPSGWEARRGAGDPVIIDGPVSSSRLSIYTYPRRQSDKDAYAVADSWIQFWGGRYGLQDFEEILPPSPALVSGVDSAVSAHGFTSGRQSRRLLGTFFIHAGNAYALVYEDEPSSFVRYVETVETMMGSISLPGRQARPAPGSSGRPGSQTDEGFVFMPELGPSGGVRIPERPGQQGASSADRVVQRDGTSREGDVLLLRDQDLLVRSSEGKLLFFLRSQVKLIELGASAGRDIRIIRPASTGSGTSQDGTRSGTQSSDGVSVARAGYEWKQSSKPSFGDSFDGPGGSFRGPEPSITNPVGQRFLGDTPEPTQANPSKVEFVPGVGWAAGDTTDFAMRLTGLGSYAGYPGSLMKKEQGAISFYWRPTEGLDEFYTEKSHQEWRTYTYGATRYDPPKLGYLLDTSGWRPASPGSFMLSLAPRDSVTWSISDGDKWYSAVWSLPYYWKWDPNRWYHFLVSWGSYGMDLYVDGELRAWDSYKGGVNTQQPFFLGQAPWYWPYGPHSMIGTYDRLEVWASQIAP